MVRLLLIVFALAVVVAMSAGGLAYFRIIPDFTGLIAPAAEGGGAAASTPVEEPVRVPPQFIEVEPFLVPVIRDGELERNIYIALRLQVAPANADGVRRHAQALRDVYLRALFDIIPSQLDSRDTLDLGKIKARLNAITDQVVGEDKVDDVLISALFER